MIILKLRYIDWLLFLYSLFLMPTIDINYFDEQSQVLFDKIISFNQLLSRYFTIWNTDFAHLCRLGMQFEEGNRFPIWDFESWRVDKKTRRLISLLYWFIFRQYYQYTIWWKFVLAIQDANFVGYKQDKRMFDVFL